MSEDGVKKSSNPIVALITGAIAGCVEAVVVWPMENIKTQLQLHKPGAPRPFSGVFEGLRYTLQTTGFFSLYTGLGVTLIGTMPKAGLRFGGNAYCKRLLADENGRLNMAQQFLAGMVRRMGRRLWINSMPSWNSPIDCDA